MMDKKAQKSFHIDMSGSFVFVLLTNHHSF